jgi:hypothetical protein
MSRRKVAALEQVAQARLYKHYSMGAGGGLSRTPSNKKVPLSAVAPAPRVGLIITPNTPIRGVTVSPSSSSSRDGVNNVVFGYSGGSSSSAGAAAAASSPPPPSKTKTQTRPSGVALVASSGRRLVRHRRAAASPHDDGDNAIRTPEPVVSSTAGYSSNSNAKQRPRREASASSMNSELF